jgi:hypothetical protein
VQQGLSYREIGCLTDQMIRRGVHKSVQAPKPASAPGSRTGTRIRGHSPGPRPLKRFSTHWQISRISGAGH